MSTGYLYNGYGKYETKNGHEDGERGIYLTYAGVPFWLPYQKVTPLPNWTFREVDQAATTPGGSGQITQRVVYREVNVLGDRIAREIVEAESSHPQTNKDRGIIIIQGKPTGQAITVNAGSDENGSPIMVEIPEREATKSEIAEADNLSTNYKKAEIQRYFAQKRERMNGGQGLLVPSRMTRIFMEELNIEDIDDVSAHAKNQGMSKEFLTELLAGVAEKTSEAMADNLAGAVQTVRNNGKAQLTNAKNGRRSLGLAEHKAKVEAEEAAKQAEEVGAVNS